VAFVGAKKFSGIYITLLQKSASPPVIGRRRWRVMQCRPYLSPTTQNELIACTGSKIREQLVRRCNNFLFRSIMADEITYSCSIQQLAICVRYVNEKKRGMSEVCEDFLGFTKCKVPTHGV